MRFQKSQPAGAATLVPSMICTIVQFSGQECALVEIRRFHHNVTRNIVTLLSSFLASMVECMGLSPG